jgi:hypothetical protein
MERYEPVIEFTAGHPSFGQEFKISWGLSRNESSQLLFLLSVDKWVIPSLAEADMLYHFLKMLADYEFYFGDDSRVDREKESGTRMRFFPKDDYDNLVDFLKEYVSSPLNERTEFEKMIPYYESFLDSNSSHVADLISNYVDWTDLLQLKNNYEISDGEFNVQIKEIKDNVEECLSRFE